MLSLGAPVLLLNGFFMSPKGLAVLGCVFSFSSENLWRTMFPLLSLGPILSKRPPVKPGVGVLVPPLLSLGPILSKMLPFGVLVPDGDALLNVEVKGLALFAEAKPGPVSSAGVPGPLALSPFG